MASDSTQEYIMVPTGRTFAGSVALLLALHVAAAAEDQASDIFSCSGKILLQTDALPLNAKSGRVVVHEWGTLTCLQNERGEAIGGINADDEPVPPFVHRI